MKKYLKLSTVVFLLGTLSFVGCRPDNPYEIGDPADRVAGLSDTWVISEVIMVDEASLTKDELDVSDYFLQGETLYTIEFTETNYTVTEGAGNNLIGASGTWAFDDVNYPTQIVLTTESGTELSLSLLAPIREVDQQLRFQVTRGCAADAPTVSYNYTFNRQ
jgi:hypothetical protein